MKRKIVQIAAAAATVSDYDLVLFALCDDGSLFSLPTTQAKKYQLWNKLPDIPQDEEEKNHEN